MRPYLAILLAALLACAWSSFYVSGDNRLAFRPQSAAPGAGGVAEAAELSEDELMAPSVPVDFFLNTGVTALSVPFAPQSSTKAISVQSNLSICLSKTILLI